MLPKPTRRAVVDVGHKCNIKCTHCYHSHEESPSFKSIDTLKTEVDKAKRRGNNYFDLTGGEPTIHPKITELVKHGNSIGMKSCIITNGLAGKVATDKILKAGVDDWLVSVHGTEKICDTIMNLTGARNKQERFLGQLRDSGSQYRFNFTMMRLNQDDLIKTAEWAVKWKPRIFNFINMNPHHAWKKDKEGTKKTIADLKVLENQLNKAIPILLDAGIGVNVRYYPMCRIAEPFRKHVCNDLHVLQDPYEWDYGIMPKTFKAYRVAGQKLSIENELKIQPCQSCHLRYICGGLNKYFFAASPKDCIKAIEQNEKINRDDFYFYRKHNTQCLSFNQNREMCIAAIADENMMAYVPSFLYCAYKAYPDYTIKVFTTYSDHTELRTITDRHLSEGFYDECVVPSENTLEEYSNDPSVVRAVRFLEFEKDLYEFDNVLWTDIDILMVNKGDLISLHREELKKDGTDCYENWLTANEGKSKLCGVHFITKQWWNKTKKARKEISSSMKNASSLGYDEDEVTLLKIVIDSDLHVSPCEKKLWRHHGIHLGDIRYAIKNSTAMPVFKGLENDVEALYEDKQLLSILSSSFKYDSVLTTCYNHLFEKKKSIRSNPVGQKRVSTKVKKFDETHCEGELLIMTACSGEYQWYVPMFIRSLQLSYPDMKSEITIYGDVDKEMLQLCSEDNSSIITKDFIREGHSGWDTASLRFLIDPSSTKFDYYLITDIDMMTIPHQHKTIIDQHMMHLKRDNTVCYENFISMKRGDECRFPGVHFVTRDWWNTTKKERKKELEHLKKEGAKEYCHDEYMIGRIVENCGLPMPPTKAKLWRHHGIHFGDWRLNMARKIIVKPDTFQKMHICTLLDDEIFMGLVNLCSEKLPFIQKVVKKWPMLFK